MRSAIRLHTRRPWALQLVWWLLACSVCTSLAACFASHGPKDSTETGNPPVIESNAVALHVMADGVHIVGAKWAPGRNFD